MRSGRGGAGGRRDEVLLAWGLSAPVLAMLSLLVLYPLVRGLLMSLQSLDYSQGASGAVVLIALVHAWNVLPLIALILVSGLQGIPSDLYAAASVDGAGAVQQFRRLTLPLLRPALAIALTAGTIAAAAIFDEIYVLNGV